MGYVTTLGINSAAPVSPLSDVIASVVGWQHPAYASSWDEMVQVVYARSNYAENKRQKSTLQTEYVSKGEVGSVVYSYKQLLTSGKVAAYNPADSGNTARTISAIQFNLGAESPTPDDIKLILRELFNGVRGNPQQIHPMYLYPTSDIGQLTAEQRAQFARAEAAEQAAENKGPENAGESDQQTVFGAIKGFFINVFTAPGEFVGAVTTTGKILSIGLPILVLAGVGLIVWAVVKKFGELDGNKALNAYADARTGRGLLK